MHKGGGSLVSFPGPTGSGVSEWGLGMRLGAVGIPLHKRRIKIMSKAPVASHWEMLLSEQPFVQVTLRKVKC